MLTPRDELLALLAQVEEVSADPEASEGEVRELTRMCATRAGELFLARARELFNGTIVPGI